MNVKLVLISIYIALIYWLSTHLSPLHALFFPTLGAFSFLLASREFDRKIAGNMLIGSTIAAVIGTLLHVLEPGAVGLLADCLLVGWLIHRFRWNAPPILAVSIIPFFVDQGNAWITPICVLLSLSGLIFLLAAANLIGEAWKSFALKSPVASEAD
ncbi:HPP family protein [Cohnella panacarvi]|uniref:HPP family protein n=1 Tax=Cohnella panacarvi TaxID=400776 RepID=UPI00047C493A|nr:HPP family protein [Cohnella panacarvi]